MGWDGMGWDELVWAGLGWDGMGWAGLVGFLLFFGSSSNKLTTTNGNHSHRGQQLIRAPVWGSLFLSPQAPPLERSHRHHAHGFLHAC